MHPFFPLPDRISQDSDLVLVRVLYVPAKGLSLSLGVAPGQLCTGLSYRVAWSGIASFGPFRRVVGEISCASRGGRIDD